MISIVDPITDASAHTNCLTKLLKSEPEPPKARGRAGIIRLPTELSRCRRDFIHGAPGCRIHHFGRGRPRPLRRQPGPTDALLNHAYSSETAFSDLKNAPAAGANGGLGILHLYAVDPHGTLTNHAPCLRSALGQTGIF